jgi:hypothetical protein
MTGEASRGLQAQPASNVGSGTALAWRLGRAGIAMLAALAVLLFVLLGTPLERLPDYPAVVLALVMAIALPGYFVQRALLSGSHPLVKTAAMPALGLGLVALPGFVALEAHTSMEAFVTMYAIVAGTACGVSTLFWPDTRLSSDPSSEAAVNPLVVLLVLMAAGGVLTTPFWAKDRVSGDFDDWTYMAYAADYVDAEHLNETEPFFGTDDEPTPRMRDNVWVLTTAMIARTSGVSVEGVMLEYLRPLLTVCVTLATVALTWTLFRDTTIGLLAGLFQLGYGLIDLSPHEGMGRNLFVRISEDKMMGAFLLFPIALVFVARFAERRTIAAVAGFALVVLGIAFVHPVPLAFLGITIAMLALLRFAQQRDIRDTAELLALLLPVGLGAIWPFVQRQLLQSDAPDLFGTEESIITFRDAFRFTEIGFGLLMGNYHMIINPMVIGAIVLTPLVWWMARRSVGGQMIAAMTLGAVTVFFVPVFATPLAEVMTTQTLWKIPWIIPVGPVFAYLSVQGAHRLASSRSEAGGGLLAGSVRLIVPATALVLFLGAALLVQEQYIRADGGSYYDWRRGGSFLPGPDESIFLGGIDRGLSGTWRFDPFLNELISYMDENIPEGSVVLAEPQQLNHMIPGVLPSIYPVDFGAAAGEGARREDVTAFIQGHLDARALDEVTPRWGIDYIVVRETESANDHLITYYRAELEQDIVPYLIYRVLK